MLHIVCCAKLLLDPNSKISCLNVASFLGRKAFENLDCYPKINNNNKIVKPFWSLRQGGMYFLKAKNKVKFKKKLFWPCTDQKQLQYAYFWKIKMNIKQFFSSNFLLHIILWCIGKVSTSLQKILIFKVPVIFWKWKLCHT